MLFGGCNCIADPASLGSLCAGGAGFVSAMMAAMVAGARTGGGDARSAAPIPEVDRLAVRIVTDNIVIQFVPTEKRGGLTIERRTGGNTTPDAPPRAALNGEWGLVDARGIASAAARPATCWSISATRPRCCSTTWRSSRSTLRCSTPWC